MSLYTDFLAVHDSFVASMNTYNSIPRDCNTTHLNNRKAMLDGELTNELLAEQAILNQMNPSNSTPIQRGNAAALYATDMNTFNVALNTYYSDMTACGY